MLHQLFVRSAMTMTLCWPLQSMYRTVFALLATTISDLTGQRVQPTLSRHTVASIVCTFGNDNDTLLAFTVNVPYCICTLGNNHFYTFVKCVATIQCILWFH